MCTSDFLLLPQGRARGRPWPWARLFWDLHFGGRAQTPLDQLSPRCGLNSKPHGCTDQCLALYLHLFSIIDPLHKKKENSSHSSLEVRYSWQCWDSCYSFIFKHLKVFFLLFITLWKGLELKINLKGLQLCKSCTKSLYQVIVCFLSGLSIIEVKIIYSSNISAIEFRSIYSLQH